MMAQRQQQKEAAELERLVQEKVRADIGFDQEYLYKDEDEKEQIAKKPEIERETILEERLSRAQEKAYMYRIKLAEEFKRKKELEAQQKSARPAIREPARKRPRRDSRDESREYSGSSSSGSSHSSDSDDRSSLSDESYADNRRRRDTKADDKRAGNRQGARRMVSIYSSESDSSDDGPYRHDKHRDSHREKYMGQQPQAGVDLASVKKEVELKEFQKICLRRRDLCKWIEHSDFQKGVKGAFVRVVYNRQYVIGEIVAFKEGNELYRVEQRETKQLVTLRNAGKTKDFRLNLISDGLCNENEFERLQRMNRTLEIDQDFITRIKNNIKDAKEIQYDKKKLSQLVFKQNQDKIRRGNFKGLNLTEIKISLLGEVTKAELAIREAKEAGLRKNTESLELLYQKAAELKELQRKVNEAITQGEGAYVQNTDVKCGARLKAKDELQEWLEKQEELRKNPEKEGENIFMYQHRKSRGSYDDDDEFAQNAALARQVRLMRLKSQKSMSGQPTQANSVNDEIQKWSYFEKLERLKRKIINVHKGVNLSEKLDTSKCVGRETIKMIESQVTPHPDWQKARKTEQELVFKAASESQSGVISFAEYVSKH